MNLNSQPVFARHETFHPRYGWLKKCFDAVSVNPEIFSREDAHIELGVGKNMARSMRYWGLAFKIIEEVPADQSNRTRYQPTPFGKFLLDDEGSDPYLEDLGSLWRLHWQLLKDPCTATAWQYTFNEYKHRELTADRLVSEMKDFLQAQSLSNEVAESSLKKDATCILRMYGRPPASDKVNEESINCPFAELGLIREAGSRGLFSLRWGIKPGMTSALITHFCFDFIASWESEANTAGLAKLAMESGSPGKALCLLSNDLYSALESCAEVLPGFRLTEAAGLIQVSYSKDPRELADAALHLHYTRHPESIELFV